MSSPAARHGVPVVRRSVPLVRHDAASAAPFRDRILELWPRVFGPVADEQDWRTRFWEQHRGRADFRLVTVENEGAAEQAGTVEREGAAEDEGALLGFAWGYTGERGQWWADMVHEALGADAGDWVGGHFEVVELAVAPEHRGQGLGGALLDALLSDLPHDRALLQTDADPAGAGHRLYRRRGWSVLGELSPGKVIMGARTSA